MIEIEVKAWVEDPEALAGRIDRIASYQWHFDREDAYWFPAAGTMGETFPSSGLRIRKETVKKPDEDRKKSVQVTFKTKEVREGIEVNDEKEFSVSRADLFEELLCRLGLSPQKRKHKSGASWRYQEITIELADVEGLGCFLEMEILKPEKGDDTVAAARSRLFDLLEALQVPQPAIETRYYTEMLEEKNHA